jgi:hypothetical protein
VLDAVGRGHPAHFLRYFPGFRTIVYFGKDVAMDIYQAEL